MNIYNKPKKKKHNLNSILALFERTVITKEEKEREIMELNLGDYKPEKVVDNDFELMSGKGHVCKVNSSLIEEVPAGVRQDNGEAYESYTRLAYELEVISEKYKGRKVWKKYNLSSTETSGKKPKTPIQKLADVFFTLGLEFNNEGSLRSANERFVEKELTVSFNSWKAPGREDKMQLHTITGEVSSQLGGSTQDQPTAKVSF